nr:hypothetical protein [Tanacetum cinerariifolium]
AESIIQVNPISEEETRNEAEKKKKEAEEKAKVHQSLYEATLTQNFDKVTFILRNREIAVTVTDKITINGNTALHIAVGTTKKTEFLRQMLEEIADKSTLLDMRNADGSTLLHVAAIVGNTDAAKILVEINHELLFSIDKEGQTPLSRALSNMHTDTYLYLLNPRGIKLDTLFVGTSGDELLVNAISSNDYNSAWVLSSHYRYNLSSDSVLMAIAQNFPHRRRVDRKQQIEMAGSSSNHVEEFAYPSHVCAPNFVTVKLSGRDMFGMWKTQMLCLLESSGMLSFIYGISPSQNSNRVLWRRSDALVKGWILGSLSEQTLRYVVNLLNTSSADFTAKDIWDKLQNIYGPTLLQQTVADSDDEEETITVEAESIIQVNPISEEETRNEAEKKKKEAEEKAKVHQSLYEATLTQNFDKVTFILRNREIAVTVTDKITINGNTALHIAVGTTKKTEFLRQMLEEIADKSTLLDMRNADGSTLLHVAAIVGNT